MQIAETFTAEGFKVDERIICTEKEYCDLMREMVEKYGDDCYTVCTDHHATTQTLGLLIEAKNSLLNVI